MEIKRILNGIKFEVLQEINENISAENMEYDSRKINKGDIFIALTGHTVDGHDFIEKAVEKGAETIFVSRKDIQFIDGINYYYIENLSEDMGKIASNFYGYPQNSLKIIGVTGTNGKTTTTYILESLLGEDKTARLGTVEYKVGDEIIPAPNTTPMSLDVVKMCKKAVDKNLKYLVMEISSHGLELGRVNMLKLDAAIFTNLTQDHLDFHKTMENYFHAKKKIFTLLKDTRNSVINIDDEYGKKYMEYTNGISYGLEKGDITGKIENISRHGQKVELKIFNNRYETELKLLGKFNLYNLLGAIGAVKCFGMKDEEIIEKIKNIHGAPGRFEPVKIDADFTVIVDYAHTGDALENILKSVNELKTGRVISVFGCGGDRDKGKRPIMAEIAEKYSDVTVATSDNPRTEDPAEILKDVVKGFKKENHIIEVDRKKAIAIAVQNAKKDDIIVIAGKGHETYQIIGREKIHFDDREAVQEALANLR